jgi:Cof subfamily protein (haloacid dehalogenase superfamily)
MNHEHLASSFEKLIAVDLDGTLVGPDSTVSPENLAAVERAALQGVAVAVVTGRPYASADRLVRELGLPCLPLVAFNGAMIRWPGAGDVLYRCCVPAALAADVVSECLRRDLHLHYYLDDVMYVSRNNHWARLYCRRSGIDCQVCEDMQSFAGREPLKLLAIDEPESIESLLPEYRRRWDGSLYITRSMDEYLEFLSPQVSKGRALEWLMTFFGVRRENAMAIGDAMNDLPLLEHAGHAAAMPHSSEQLKALADFVPQQQATGVAEAVDWFLHTA